MNLLICLNTLTTGGAELFAIRMANELSRRGVKVYLFNFRKDKIEDSVEKKINHIIPVINSRLPSPRLLEKFDGLFFNLGIKFSILDFLTLFHLKRIIRKNNINVVHSHLYTVDKVVVELKKSFPTLKIITTIHGDYEANILKELSKQRVYRESNFFLKTLKIIRHIDHIVCITKKQTDLFSKLKIDGSLNFEIHKIYNGYPNVDNSKKFPVEKIGIKKSDFIYGMVSRGIAEKGWEIAIEAFIKINASHTHLILVGSSIYIDELKVKYSNFGNIHFFGYRDNVLEIINCFHVGLLPSQIVTESLPTVIIEYLACGCPVIASEVGEVKEMIKSVKGDAGEVIPLNDNQLYLQNLIKTMSKFEKNKSLYSFYSSNSKEAFEKFKLAKCVDRYQEIYNS